MIRSRKNRSLQIESLETRSLMAADLQAAGVFSSGIPDTQEIAVGDVNGDKIADVVAIGSAPSNQAGTEYKPVLNVFLADGRGGFRNSQSSSWEAKGASSRLPFVSPVLVDVNSDGKLDLILGNRGMGAGTRVMLGDGAGRFADSMIFGNSRVYSVANADLNRDGKMDLVVLEQGISSGRVVSQVVALMGNGAGGFSRLTPTVPLAPMGRPASLPGTDSGKLAVGDFDRDGRTDVAVTNNADNVVYTLFGRGDGRFDLGPNLAVAYPTDLAIGDFNGDGADDLAVLRPRANSVVVWKGGADRRFAQTSEFVVGSQVAALAVADLDGDGTRDLAIVSSQGSGMVTTLSGRGDGTFGDRRDVAVPAPTSSLPIIATDLAMADFNNDGRMDVVVGGRAATPFSVGNKATIALLTNNTAVAGKSTYKLSQSEYYVDEGERVLKVVVNRSGGIAQPDSVWFRTSSFVNYEGSATSGLDFAPIKFRVNFAEGETTKNVFVPIINDKLVEGRERFLVSVSDTETMTPTTQFDMSIVYINDNDQYGTFQFSWDTVYNKQTGTMTLTIERTNGIAGDVDIQIGAISGERWANPGVDYDFQPFTVRFGEGETRKTIEIRGIKPSAAGKYVILYLASLSNGQFGELRGVAGLIG